MGNSLESAKIVKASDKKSTDFTYDGTGFEADTDWVLMLGDTQLTMNAGGGLSNYQIYQDGQPVADNNPVDAGDYTIRNLRRRQICWPRGRDSLHDLADRPLLRRADVQ